MAASPAPRTATNSRPLSSRDASGGLAGFVLSPVDACERELTLHQFGGADNPEVSLRTSRHGQHQLTIRRSASSRSLAPPRSRPRRAARDRARNYPGGNQRLAPCAPAVTACSTGCWAACGKCRVDGGRGARLGGCKLEQPSGLQSDVHCTYVVLFTVTYLLTTCIGTASQFHESSVTPSTILVIRPANVTLDVR